MASEKFLNRSIIRTELNLVGNKVRLAEFTIADITENHINWLNDPQVNKYSNQRFKLHTFESCLDYLMSFKNTNNLYLSIKNKRGGVRVGSITAYNKLEHGTCDIGILIGNKEYLGQGYGLDALSTLIDYLQQSLNVRKITCGTTSLNEAMIRLAKSAGMIPDGIRKKQEIIDGEFVDILYFAKFID